MIFNDNQPLRKSLCRPDGISSQERDFSTAYKNNIKNVFLLYKLNSDNNFSLFSKLFPKRCQSILEAIDIRFADKDSIIVAGQNRSYALDAAALSIWLDIVCLTNYSCGVRTKYVSLSNSAD